MHTVKWFQVLLYNSHDLTSIVCLHGLFDLTHRYDSIRCYQSRTVWVWEWWHWRDTPHSLNLQHYWNLTIRLFSVIARTLIGGVLPLCREAVGVFYSPSRLGYIYNEQIMYTILRWKKIVNDSTKQRKFKNIARLSFRNSEFHVLINTIFKPPYRRCLEYVVCNTCRGVRPSS